MANHNFSVDVDEDIDIDTDEIRNLEDVVKDIEPDEALFIAYLAGYTKGVKDEKNMEQLPFDDKDSFKKHVADGYEQYRKREGIYAPDAE